MLEWFLEKIGWISKNKEWIFSGIGIFIVTIVFAIFKYIKKIFRKEENISNIPVTIKRQKINVSSKDLERWENLNRFFYTSGLLKRITNFNFGNGYREDYFNVNGVGGSDNLAKIEEDPLPYFDDESLQEYFNNFSINYQNAMELLCCSYFSDIKPGYMIINKNYQTKIKEEKGDKFSYYISELKKNYKKLYDEIKKRKNVID